MLVINIIINIIKKENINNNIALNKMIMKQYIKI